MIGINIILLSGMFFTIKLRFIQLDFKNMYKNIIKKTDKGIKPIQTLFMSLAGKIGVGSIAGIALAIYLGGVGTIFWMWIISFLLTSICFVETVLGVVYKEKDGHNIYKGGPSYYIKKGLGFNKLASLYAIIIIVSYTVGFITIQSNTIVKSINYVCNISPLLIGIILIVFTLFSISKGVTLIAKITSILVPFMLLLYFIVSMYIILVNINQIPYIILEIINEAFNFKSGFIGFLTSILIGTQRGIFSNEASLGTGVISSSTVVTNDSSSQGFVQMVGVYITSLFVCTSSAFIILTSKFNDFNVNDINGIELSIYSFKYHLGNFGSVILILTIILFSFSTILTGYYNGESNLKFLFPKLKKMIILKIFTLLMVMFGCILPSSFIWSIVDILVILLAFINIYALFLLKDVVIEELKGYRSRNIN